MFHSEGGELNTRVLREMKAVLLENDEPPWLNDSAVLLLRSARTIASNSGIKKSNVLCVPNRIQWFPWIGTRGVLTLKAYAAAGGIRHETDKLSITYWVENSQEYFEHINGIVHSPMPAEKLAVFMPVKAIQKFDGFISDELLNLANGHDYFDLKGAREAAESVLQSKL